MSASSEQTMSTRSRGVVLAGLLGLVVLLLGFWQVMESRADGKGDGGQVQVENNLGWRLGTAWTVRMSQYASYLAEPEWVSGDFRFQVVGVDPAAKTFTVSVHFADPGYQPTSAQGELIRAVYAVKAGALRLASLQLEGRGPRLSPAEGETVLGNNFFSLELPAAPFAGESVTVDAPHLGTQRGSKVQLGVQESATLTRGAPWWVTYAKGGTLKAELTSFSR